MSLAMTRTYVTRQSSRGCAEFGPSDLTYTDVVDFAAGETRTHVKGRCDGAWVDQRSSHAIDPACTPEGVDAARINSGWTRIEVA